MNVMVADSSAFLDLQRGGFLEKCLGLPYQFTVPDLLCRAELVNRTTGSGLVPLGLRVEELNGDEVSSAMRFRRQLPTICLQDSFALALATIRRWILLTSDDVIRAFASSMSVACRSVLWMIDQLFYAGVANAESLVSGLSALQSHPGCRIPHNEIAVRIDHFSSTAKLP